jgi:hypothetical protein
MTIETKPPWSVWRMRGVIGVAFAATSLGMLFAGCTTSEVTAPDSGVDSDVDSGVEAAAPVCTGETIYCFIGSGGNCSDVVRPGQDITPKCTESGWKCPAGSIPMQECKCGVPPSCPKDAGNDGSLDADAASDASVDADVDGG